jgi:hypothetical protein
MEPRINYMKVRAWRPMINTRRPTLRRRSRMQLRRSPKAVLARCMVRVNTRMPSCNSELSVG